MTQEKVNVRYFVNDVQAAINFYIKHFGFELMSNKAPAFADITRGHLRLLLSGKTSTAGKAMPDGTVPTPGGWNRFELVVDNIEAEVERLRKEGVPFRNEILTSPSGSQIIALDPSGNLIELFQPAKS